MAIVNTTHTVVAAMGQQTGSITPWQINATSADATGCETILASPGTGYHLCISRLIIGIGAAITVTVGAGKSGTAVEGAFLGPVGGAAGTYVMDFRDRPIRLTAAKALTVDASGAGSICVYVEGFTKAT
jgi:hypothetical protein